MSISWFSTSKIDPKLSPLLKLYSDKSSATPLKTIQCAVINGYEYQVCHCTIPDLTYDTVYYYVLLNSKTEVYLENSENRLDFTMVNPLKSSVTILQIGDSGIKTKLLDNIAKRMDHLETDFDLMLHLGDISYADDYDLFGKNPDYVTNWAKFSTMVSNITSSKPYMVCPGNHDVTCHTYGDEFCPQELRNFTTYRNWFNMPDSVGPKLWYSFDYGDAHFTFINTESDFPGCPNDRLI
eukprot:UN24815